jgi:hypothetical protein
MCRLNLTGKYGQRFSRQCTPLNINVNDVMQTIHLMWQMQHAAAAAHADFRVNSTFTIHAQQHKPDHANHVCVMHVGAFLQAWIQEFG